MKESLKKSIVLFAIKNQIKLYLALGMMKLKIKIPESYAVLFQKCTDYVKAIEAGVSFKKTSQSLIQASLSINNKSVTVFLRSESSDIKVLESVLLHGEYKPAVQKLIQSNGNTVKEIVDAGGNIGLTSIYLHCYFPEARFIIVEPDDKNFSLLTKNIEANGISNSLLLRRALWTKNEPLIIEDSFRDGKEWSLTVSSKQSANSTNKGKELEGITFSEICIKNNHTKIDLFKIDIEGAERYLFANSDFLNTVNSSTKNLVIEIHDEFNIRDGINSKMKDMDFTREEFGDITLFSKQ